ncbi:hypothetical protein ABIE26_005316 [Pedobacter africanus]|uniref:Uncharacterized protein n=1 Tax=Pedobacter africanus TaxID=151894 RepID=A0ACC6L510_9SPHI|nr:hypothetical protein [Pedobacter africanus]MDR6786497.1 hypothetical protein [Pedobacter africanus]
MNTLLLELFFNRQNYGKLVFKAAGQILRLDKLSNVLPFVASLHQLSKAIDTGAHQDCGYELKAVNGTEWLLDCKFARGIVDLQLWFHKLGFNERLETLFDWRGTAAEFGDAVKRLIERLPKYRFVFW